MNSLKGQLLLAARRLSDPNFTRSVILMVQHGDDGALGLVLNRPMDVTVQEACRDVLDAESTAEGMLHQGGPCQGPLMAVHTHPEHGDIEVIPRVYFSTQRDELEWLLKHDKVRAKFFVGYSGWSPGQLEKEMEIGSWLTVPATEELVFADGGQWAGLVTRLTLGGGIRPDQVPEDPSVN